MDISDLKKAVDERRGRMMSEFQVILDAQTRAFNAVVSDHAAVRHSPKLKAAIAEINLAISDAYQLASCCKWGD